MLGAAGRRALFGAAAFAAAALLLAAVLPRRPKAGEAVARRGTLSPAVPLVGTLSSERAETYGAVAAGVELKILWLVEEGVVVSAGQPLIRFDPAPFTTELETARARAAELSEEAEQARLSLAALGLKAESDLEEARAAAASSERDLEAFVNTDAPLAAQESAHDLAQKERSLGEAEEKLAGLAPFVSRGYVSREEFRAAQSRRDQAAADVKLSRARHAALVQQSNPNSIRQKIDETQTERVRLQTGERRAGVEATRAQAGLRLSELRRDEARRQAAEAERKIAACEVRAKGPGLAVHAEIYDKAGERRKVRSGDAIWGGTTVVHLPDLSRMLVDGRVAESEIHLLASGQRVNVTLDAFPGSTLAGTLRRVGSLAGSEPSASRAFPVTISLDGSDPRFRPGMIARARIHCGKVEDAIYIPLEAVRSDERGHFCLVVKRGKAVPRRVVLGVTTAEHAEVREGLREGEIVRVADL